MDTDRVSRVRLRGYFSVNSPELFLTSYRHYSNIANPNPNPTPKINSVELTDKHRYG